MPSYQRRSFLGKTALAGAGMLAAAGANRPGRRKEPGKKDSPPRLNSSMWDSSLRPLGALAILGAVINPTDGWTRRTGMVISHCWDIDKTDEERFSTTYDCERGEKLHGHDRQGGRRHHSLVRYRVRCNKHLVKPYLEAGIPVFINPPLCLQHGRRRSDRSPSRRKRGRPSCAGARTSTARK